jgi:hypothetical protein
LIVSELSACDSDFYSCDSWSAVSHSLRYLLFIPQHAKRCAQSPPDTAPVDTINRTPRRCLVLLKQIVRKFDQVFWQSIQWKTTYLQLDAICFNLCCRDSKVRILDSSSGFRDSLANGVSIGR